MMRTLFAILLVGCTGNADVGLSGQPVTCQPGAAGAVNGTVTNTYTHKSYTFGTPQATLTAGAPNQSGPTVTLDDSTLALSVQFPCGQPALGTYDAGGGQAACPLSAFGIVSARAQQVYGTSDSGVVIVDQNVGCIAGRYDMHFGTRLDSGAVADEGELAGWFSVPTP